jgi:pyridoxal phosphate enzyme (YggS family)
VRDLEHIQENIQKIEERIQAACERCGRNPSEVTLIAVSKTKPIAMIQEAYEFGIRHFGENRVQELVEKYDNLRELFPQKIYWHQIGHLQRNKVKYLVDKATLIHSLDSMRLALQIEEEAAKRDLTIDILIEVNIAGEETKFGVAPEELMSFLEEVWKLPHIRVRGLMTIAPYVLDPEENRKHFKKMRELYVDIKTKNYDNKDTGNNPHHNQKLDYFDTLSMGMTGDFEVAIEEGATMVRVGTGIFGER